MKLGRKRFKIRQNLPLNKSSTLFLNKSLEFSLTPGLSGIRRPLRVLPALIRGQRRLGGQAQQAVCRHRHQLGRGAPSRQEVRGLRDPIQ